MRQHDLKRLANTCALRNLLLLALGMLCAGSCAPALGQVTTADFACNESSDFYEQRGFIVKAISVRPILKFIPAGPEMKESLLAAEQSLAPSQSGLQVGEAFSSRKLSHLLSELSSELERRQLRGRTGFAYLTPRLRNCDAKANPPTLEVEYLLLTVARPSYLTGSFELLERKEPEKEEAGAAALNRSDLSATPRLGYNRSRGIYGGAALSLKKSDGVINRFDLAASGSGSSGVADMSLAGSRELSSGPLSYAEWRLGYRYSYIPAGTIRLQEATVLGQFFGATQSLGSHNLFFRFGASIEGGNRQTDLDQSLAPESTRASARHGALKLYVGGTISTSKQDWKSSYGLQLGESGDGFGLDYVKQVFDTAYRARFLPREQMPLQLDLQFTAGSVRAAGGGIPIAERFFGGNVEREFISGDTWRIRSDPFIRSFPQYRFNRSEGLAIGGKNFVSINLTVAQTVWGRQLLPKEISRDPDVTAGLGGQMLTARRVLREGEVQSSARIQALKSNVHSLTPILARLKAALAALKSGQPPAQVSESIDSFFNADPDSGVAPIPDSEDAIESAVLDPSTFKQALEDQAAIAQYLNNPIEGNARMLAVDSPEDDTKAYITILREKISALNKALQEAGSAERAAELSQVAGQLEAARSDIEKGLDFVNQLRAYAPDEVERTIRSLNDPAPGSGRTLDQILEKVRQQIKPIKESARLEPNGLAADQGDETVTNKRAELGEMIELIDTVDTYAEKAESALEGAREFSAKKQFDESRYFVESLAIGLGAGIPSYLSGLAGGVRDLRKSFADRGLTAEWQALREDSDDLLAIQKKIETSFKRVTVPAAEQKANQTVSYVGRVLGVFFRELNLVGVSPVFMFDAARLGPANPADPSGFRYGVGTGVRFSLVNLDFTAGYSFNLKRRPGEGRGAFVLTMDVVDLFR